jgi:hypothetical protein
VFPVKYEIHFRIKNKTIPVTGRLEAYIYVSSEVRMSVTCQMSTYLRNRPRGPICMFPMS